MFSPAVGLLLEELAKDSWHLAPPSCQGPHPPHRPVHCSAAAKQNTKECSLPHLLRDQFLALFIALAAQHSEVRLQKLGSLIRGFARTGWIQGTLGSQAGIPLVLLQGQICRPSNDIFPQTDLHISWERSRRLACLV